MAYQIEFEPETGVIVIAFQGEFRLADIRAYRAALAADPRFREDMVRLIDLRQAHIALTAQEIFQASLLLKTSVLGRKLAFLVASRADYGAVRMLHGFSGYEDIVGVFEEMDEARRWLLDE